MWVRGYQIVPAKVDEGLEVDRVFSGFPVGVAGQLGSFGLYTTANDQFVAYYDSSRRLCVASRVLGDRHWKRALLPETLGWDSHNYVTLAIDPAGHVHVSGNMHVSPLSYYRSSEPGDVSTLQRVPRLTGTNEDAVTYPRFLHDPSGSLVFTYRHGHSGAGNQVFRAYDHHKQQWKALHHGTLFDGEGKRNAYLQGPRLGPDGYFHLCWVWRDTPDAASTHTLCYARSRDLQRWETSAGTQIARPIIFERAEIVDPVQCNSGLINNNHLIGFDAQGRVVISYQKHDEFGNTQIYQARRESPGWAIRRTTDWAHRWEIGGPGSIVFELQFGPVESDAEGRLVQWYRHARYGAGTLLLDPETLEAIGRAEGLLLDVPPELETPVSNFPGMRVNWAVGHGPAPDATRYFLRWETLHENRDAPRNGPVPEPSALYLYKIAPGRVQSPVNGPRISFYWDSIPPGSAGRGIGSDQKHRMRPKRLTWLNRLLGRSNCRLAEASPSVEAGAKAEAAFAAGDWTEAAKQWQCMPERSQQESVIDDRKLKLAVARRLARLEPYRRHVTSYAASRAAESMGRSKIAVYTAIVGDHDSVKLPEVLDPRFDFFLFSDAPRSGGGVWQVRPMTAFDTDPTRMARYVKMHPHTLLGNYEFAIWIDSNVMILGDIHGLLDAFIESGEAVAAFPHPYRTSIYEEIEACIAQGLDDAETMREQIARYRKAGFAHQDLIESNLMMFNLSDRRVRALLDLWWSEIERGSRRDQLSLNYALAQIGLGWHPIASRPDNARTHLMLAFGGHDRDKGVARRLVDEVGAPPSDPYQGTPYDRIREQRIAAQRERRIDIVVCVHNALDHVSACLESVRRHRTTQRIIIVDDGSDAPTAAFLSAFAKNQSEVELIRHDQPGGYTRAANRGLAASRGEFVILLNSDTIVTDGWAEKMADAVFSTPGAGVVGPMSSAASWQSIPNHRGTEQQTAVNLLPAGMTAEDMNRCCEQWTIDGIVPRVPLVHGFCFGLTREIIDKVGYFDETHFPGGYGEENDYCFRAADAGFGLVVATHTYVFHAKSKSYVDTDRIRLTGEASQTLHRLHSPARIRRAVEAMEHNPLLWKFRQNAAKLAAISQ
jgi:GT2 family glycosyltransferase